MSKKQVYKAVVMSVISADCVVTENKMEIELMLKENDEVMHAIRPKAESLGDVLRVFGEMILWNFIVVFSTGGMKRESVYRD